MASITRNSIAAALGLLVSTVAGTAGAGDDRLVRIVARTEVSTLEQIPERVREAAQDGPDCMLETTVEMLGAVRFTINDDWSIWQLPCYLAAYQASHVHVQAVMLDGDLNAALMVFPGSPSSDPAEEVEIVNPEVDIATSTLTSFALGRGLGDCGRYARYELVRGEGESIDWELVELREKDDCNGVEDDPTAYPLIWQR
ncbi:DUF1176 domain-containing protein [Polymorphum gilvum]|uniref:Uncharacterized protein n=1 Tax=Polymorphum gilvum (strain LMG 25793 / CGMCC 1.9160 / SL003B-26A1) TaxID=991905 RepID=F2IZV8_POLGS|nr:DUF1176 domain-containing protein [Polymorphum gilvum]ADZ70684.1 hypothetical protein SL003B_2259 [Polymorphum gilvum SL003B-26A1]